MTNLKKLIKEMIEQELQNILKESEFGRRGAFSDAPSDTKGGDSPEFSYGSRNSNTNQSKKEREYTEKEKEVIANVAKRLELRKKDPSYKPPVSSSSYKKLAPEQEERFEELQSKSKQSQLTSQEFKEFSKLRMMKLGVNFRK